MSKKLMGIALAIVAFLSLGAVVSATTINVSPNLAFFIVDVGTQSGQIQLEGMLPRTLPYSSTSCSSLSTQASVVYQ